MTHPELHAPDLLVQRVSAMTMPPRRPFDQRDEQARRDAHTVRVRRWLDDAYADGFRDGMDFTIRRAPARLVLTTAEFEQARAKLDGTEQGT